MDIDPVPKACLDRVSDSVLVPPAFACHKLLEPRDSVQVGQAEERPF